MILPLCWMQLVHLVPQFQNLRWLRWFLLILVHWVVSTIFLFKQILIWVLLRMRLNLYVNLTQQLIKTLWKLTFIIFRESNRGFSCNYTKIYTVPFVAMNKSVKTFDGLDHQYTLEQIIRQIDAKLIFTMGKQTLDPVAYKQWHKRKKAYIQYSLSENAFSWFLWLSEK